jgi:hypothetical protein
MNQNKIWNIISTRNKQLKAATKFINSTYRIHADLRLNRGSFYINRTYKIKLIFGNAVNFFSFSYFHLIFFKKLSEIWIPALYLNLKNNRK